MRDRLTARGTVGMAAVAVGTVGLAAVVAWLLAPTGLGVESCGTGCFGTVTEARGGVPPALFAVLAAALLAGVLAAVLARRHLRRLVPLRPAQHARRLVPPTSRHVLLVATISACVLGVAWLEGTGRADLFFSVGVAVGALLTLARAAGGLAHGPLRARRPRAGRRPDRSPRRAGSRASTPTARASSRPWSPPTERLDRTSARTG